MSIFGFRSVQVIEEKTEGDFGRLGCQMIEVTNNGTTEVKVFVNEFNGNLSNNGIPIKAGQTRQIPMYVFNFRATGAVTVIGYRA